MRVDDVASSIWQALPLARVGDDVVEVVAEPVRRVVAAQVEIESKV